MRSKHSTSTEGRNERRRLQRRARPSDAANGVHHGLRVFAGADGGAMRMTRAYILALCCIADILGQLLAQLDARINRLVAR